jgi:hypothetical protein
MREQLPEYIQKFEWCIRMIEHETGLTPVAMGGTPQASALKSTTELSIAGTQNVIRPIIDSIMGLKGRMAQSAMLRLQMLLKTKKSAVKAYSKVISKVEVEQLKIAENRAVAYGISLAPRPDNTQRENLYKLIQEAMSVGRDGVVSIDLDDGITLINQLEHGGNLDEIALRLSYKIKRKRQERRKENIESQQLESQKNERLAQVKSQEDMRMKQADALIKEKEDARQHQYDKEIKQFEYNGDYKLKVLEFAHDRKMAKIKEEGNGERND